MVVRSNNPGFVVEDSQGFKGEPGLRQFLVLFGPRNKCFLSRSSDGFFLLNLFQEVSLSRPQVFDGGVNQLILLL